MFIDGFGKVGIGTGQPLPGPRLTVSGSGNFNTSLGAARFDLVNPVLGSGISQYLSDTGVWSIGKTDGTTRMLIAPSGNVGIGTITPSAQLQIAGNGANGFTLGVEGHATQNLDKGGFVKAMVSVDPFQQPANYVQLCYNGTTGASTGNCGFSVVRNGPGNYTVQLGFDARSRFVLVTPQAAPFASTAFCELASGCNVIIHDGVSTHDYADASFNLLIF